MSQKDSELEFKINQLLKEHAEMDEYGGSDLIWTGEYHIQEGLEFQKKLLTLIATHTNQLIDELLSELPDEKHYIDEKGFYDADTRNAITNNFRGFNQAISEVTAILENKKGE